MGEAIKVLVVEDESTIQSILGAFMKRYAKEHDMTVEINVFTDPVKGLFELSSNGSTYSVIFLDVRLPKLTGDEIYSSLELVNPELKGKVMFVTGYPDDLRDRFPNADLTILEKPFRYDGFAEKIARLFAHR